jgi:ABC-type spermidine/putrescine transport system permease subunit II
MTAVDIRQATASPFMVSRPISNKLGFSLGWGKLAKWCGYSALILTYFPLFWLALMSVSERPLSGLPFPLSFEHYRALASEPRWIEPFLSSIAIGLAVAVVCMIVATAVGRAIPNARRPGALVLFAVIPLFVPGMSMGAALFIFLRTFLDLKLGYWAVFLGHIVWALPFSLLMVLVIAVRFDHRLLEAAEDLGASAWRRFWDIEFPILRPGIVGAGLFGFLLSFNEILRSTFLRGLEATMPVWNWMMAASQQSQVPIIFSLSTIVLVFTLPLLGGFFWVLFVKLDKS